MKHLTKHADSQSRLTSIEGDGNIDVVCKHVKTVCSKESTKYCSVVQQQYYHWKKKSRQLLQVYLLKVAKAIII